MLLITKLLKFQQRSPQEFPQWFLFRKRERENVFRSNVLVRVVGNKSITPRKKRNVGWISVKCSSCSRSWKLVSENSFKISPRKTILLPALHVSFLVLFFFFLYTPHVSCTIFTQEKIGAQRKNLYARKMYSICVIQIFCTTVLCACDTSSCFYSSKYVSFTRLFSCVLILCDTCGDIYGSKCVTHTV